MHLTCYLNSRKPNARKLLEAFAKGSPAKITTDLRALRPGGAVLYGVDESTLPLWLEITARGIPYYYIDNGYFKSRYYDGDYYRITYNAPQYVPTMQEKTDGFRWAQLGLTIQPWRDGWQILVALQSEFWHQRHGMPLPVFVEYVKQALKWGSSPRPIVFRGKPDRTVQPSLKGALLNSWAVVTHSSNVAVDGLLEGVPCFCLHPCAATPMGLSDLRRIESPHKPDDRARWAAILADHQWSLTEIENGTAWRSLIEHGSSLMAAKAIEP